LFLDSCGRTVAPEKPRFGSKTQIWRVVFPTLTNCDFWHFPSKSLDIIGGFV
jgi:hypothetical protein